MNLPQLLAKGGIDEKTLFCDIVKKWAFTQSIHTTHLQKQIEQAPDKAAYLKTKISEYNAFFVEGIQHPAFLKMYDVSELVRFGFNLQRGNPFATIYQIINEPEFKDYRFKFSDSMRDARYLTDVSKSYQGVKVNELKDEDEKTFEAFSYVVEGGNFAMVLKFLSEYGTATGKDGSMTVRTADVKNKVYYLLKCYFEKKCKQVLTYDIQKIADETGFGVRALENKNKDLIKIEYGVSHGGNHNQVKALHSAYQMLLNDFESTNQTAFKEVETRLTILSSTYGDLLS